ncbi:MAG: universal stress protein, partial [Phycisphaerales bacterium]
RGKPVPVILEELGSGQGRAVVIGARGRTGAAGVLLGTVTEQLIRRSPSPVLAVKKKGECLGVLRALLAIAGPED